MENSNSLSDQDILYIAHQAFLYGLPLVLTDITLQQTCGIVNVNDPPKTPINKFSNQPKFLTSNEEIVVRPNFDTYYSTAFFDLTQGPLVLDIPITDAQYYMMPLLDAFTNVIPGSPGTRTGETQGGRYLLFGPTVDGYPNSGLPTDIDTSYYIPIPCPTNTVWAIGRFQVNNATQKLGPIVDGQPTTVNKSYAAYGGAQVVKLQSLLTITPANGDAAYPSFLNQYGSGTPNDIVNKMDITDFFNYLNPLLITNPPTHADTPAMNQFAKIGVGPNLTFQSLPDLLQLMDDQKKFVMNKMIAGGTPSLKHWNVNLSPAMANFGTDYPFRAGVAVAGLGANLVADAAYFSAYGDSDFNPLNGSNKYTITFDMEPPQNAFWSLTMYGADGFPISGSHRCALGHDSVNPLVKGKDGSFVIYIQNEAIPPTDPRFNNWLPAPSSTYTPQNSVGDTPGAFNVMLRVYWPDKSALNGDWMPPLIQKVASAS